MRVALTLTLAVWAGLMLPGCQAGPSPAALGPSVEGTVQHYGGLKALLAVESIDTLAVVTVYRDGVARVTAQDMTIWPNEGRIRSTADEPAGRWTATVSLSGRGSVTTSGGLSLSADEKEQIRDLLRLILHRVRGPINLFGGGERAGKSEDVFTAGYRLTRVESSGRSDLAEAYYFDRDAAELRLVTAAGESAGEPGTVTTYFNRETSGVWLPASLKVVEMGRDSLIGETRLLDVEFKDVRVNR